MSPAAGAWALWLPVALAAEPEEVVVTASEAQDSAPGTTVLDVASTARPGDGVEDVLATAPGVRVRRLGGLGAFAGVSLRGTGFRQTLVRLDGVPLNPDGREAVDLSQWPLAGLAEIRVRTGRPPASVPGTPIGGVVDLVSRTGSRFLTGEVGAGSFGAVRGRVSGGGPWGGAVPGDVLVAADVLATTGGFAYLDDGGTRYVTDDDTTPLRDNNDRRQGAVLARLRLGDDDARGTLMASLAARDEGLPGPIGLPQDATRLTTERALVSLTGDGRVGGGRLTGRAWWRGRTEVLSDAGDELVRTPDAQRDRYGTVGAELSGAGALHPVVGLRGSVDARREGFGRTRTDAEGPTLTASRWGFGGAVDLPLHTRDGVLEVTPGVAARGLLSTAPDDGSVGAVLPGLDVVVRPVPAVQIWTSGGAAFRPPDLTELYGDRGALVGNADLRPERAFKAEVGVRGAWEGPVRGAAQLAGFGRWTTQAIGWLQNTQRTLVAVNFGATRVLGGDAGAEVAWADHVGARTSVSFAWARQTTDDPTRQGRPVPFVAPVRAWGRVWGRPGLGIELGVDVDHTAAVPVDPQGITTQPARTLMGVYVSWTSPDAAWTLSTDLRNATDVRTGPIDRDPLGADDATVPAPITDLVGYPLPGRTLWVAVRFTPPLDRP